MVKNIYDGVVQLNQEQRAIYKPNLDTYTQKLDLLDREIHSLLSSINRRYFIVYHPTFAYFARDYNLNMIAIEEEGKEPSAADITRVIELAKKYAIKTVFASPQFNPQSAQIISREIGGKVVFFDHLSQNYVENMRNFTIELVKALK